VSDVAVVAGGFVIIVFGLTLFAFAFRPKEFRRGSRRETRDSTRAVGTVRDFDPPEPR
jgi:hypothetical protein